MHPHTGSFLSSTPINKIGTQREVQLQQTCSAPHHTDQASAVAYMSTVREFVQTRLLDKIACADSARSQAIPCQDIARS